MSYIHPRRKIVESLNGKSVLPTAFLFIACSLVSGCADVPQTGLEADDVGLEALRKASTPLSLVAAPTLCLEPVNGSLRNGTIVRLVTCDNTSVQLWMVDTTSGSIGVGNRMCLDVKDGRDETGNDVQLWQCFKGNTNQQFDTAQGSLRWRNTNKCLTMAGGAVSGATLKISPCKNGAAEQIWLLLGQTSDAPATPVATPEPEPILPTSPSIARDQSGSGWGGADLLDPSSTSTYRAPSLDGLLAMPNSLVARQLGPQQDILDAIRKVTSETGVPSGLLAAMIVQESNGDRNTESNNPGYGSQPADQRKDVGIIQSPLWRFEGTTTAQKLQNAKDPYKNLRVFAAEASQTYQKTGSWGQVAQVWYTGYTADRLGGVTGGSSSETNYVLNVFSHLAMGGTTYYPAGGYKN